jgi:CBS domain-containing protein/ribosome-associated translation inhibitor RaiA
MQLRDFMRTRVVTIGPEEAASVAWSRMRGRRIRHLVVKDGARVVGVVSEHDLGGHGGGEVRRGRLVRDLMSPRLVSATPATTLRNAASLMRRGPIGSLPVLDGDRLVGIVTATDVLDQLGRTTSRAIRRRRGTSSRQQPVPDSRKRAPFPDRIPRAFRREAGRPDAPLIPTYIRPRGIELGPDDRTYIRRKLGMKLGKFASSVERVSVRVEDLNGPRGGVDHVCRIKVVLSGLPSVIYERRGASLEAAVDGALAGVERAVRRSVQRRRMTPGKGGRRGAAVSVT